MTKEKLRFLAHRTFKELCSTHGGSFTSEDLDPKNWEIVKAFQSLFYDKRAEFNLPKSEIESIARVILPDIVEYFESEEGKREFAEWKAEQERLKNLKENELAVGNSTT